MAPNTRRLIDFYSFSRVDLKRSSKRYMTSHTGTLLQVYDKATALDPLPEVPTMAHMATAPFTSVPAEQPEFGPFLVRMLAQWYHPGGAAKMAATGAPAGTQPLIGIDGDMLAQADFTRPEGTYLLDVRCAKSWEKNGPTILDFLSIFLGEIHSTRMKYCGLIYGLVYPKGRNHG